MFASFVLCLMMDKQSLNEFLKKFSGNRHTEQEHQLFIDWLNAAPVEQIQEVLEKYQHVFEIQSSGETVQYPQLIEKIEARLDNLEATPASEPVMLWYRLSRVASIAAILFVITAFGIYFWINRNLPEPVMVKKENGFHKNEISPGGNKAILTLANGSKIILDNAKNGVLATQSGISIRKTANGQLIYDLSGGQHSTSPSVTNQPEVYNTITTPRGGQYQLTLPDGSKVWLNAASSLKFPASFTGQERNVELTGEAYFEIAKATSPSDGVRIPFKVTSGNQTVEVLGTHFNINAYPDEATINTTLLEGSVKISLSSSLGEPARMTRSDGGRGMRLSQLLYPGQQAKVGAGIRVSNIDAAQAIAWKNGYFIFPSEDIGSIMRKISRWYDADIKYEGDITRERFVGSVSRFENVSQVLDMLELTGSVHFKIVAGNDAPGKERRIIVMP